MIVILKERAYLLMRIQEELVCLSKLSPIIRKLTLNKKQRSVDLGKAALHYSWQMLHNSHILQAMEDETTASYLCEDIFNR